jgi:hypothetical protein
LEKANLLQGAHRLVLHHHLKLGREFVELNIENAGHQQAKYQAAHIPSAAAGGKL